MLVLLLKIQMMVKTMKVKRIVNIVMNIMMNTMLDIVVNIVMKIMMKIMMNIVLDIVVNIVLNSISNLALKMIMKANLEMYKKVILNKEMKKTNLKMVNLKMNLNLFPLLDVLDPTQVLDHIKHLDLEFQIIFLIYFKFLGKVLILNFKMLKLKQLLLLLILNFILKEKIKHLINIFLKRKIILLD